MKTTFLVLAGVLSVTCAHAQDQAAGTQANGKELVKEMCFVAGPLGDQENPAITKGQLCVDTHGDIRKRTGVKDCWNFSQTVYDVNKCFKTATADDIQEYRENIQKVVEKALKAKAKSSAEFAYDLQIQRNETEVKALELRCDDFQAYVDNSDSAKLGTTTSGKSCSVNSLKDADRTWVKRFTLAPECIYGVIKSCRLAVDEALKKSDRLIAARNGNNSSNATGQIERVSASQDSVKRLPAVDAHEGGKVDAAPAVKGTN